jgi:lipooligosaccharide transport system permease protein
MGVFRTGNLSSRFLRVWQRNFTVYKKNWKIGFIPPILEPIFYIAAFGIGLSMMIKEFSYRGEPISYTAFIAPALIAVNIMNSAFFENTSTPLLGCTIRKPLPPCSPLRSHCRR